MIKEFLQYIETTKTANTYSTYRTAITTLFPCGYAIPTREFVLEFIRNQKDKSPNTIKNRLVVLSKFIKFHKLSMADTQEICEQYKGIEKVQPCPTTKEINSILDGIRSKKYRAIFLFAAHAGLRISEIIRLDMADLRNGQAIIREPKNKQEEVVVLSTALNEAISEYLNERQDNSPALFTGTHGRLSKRVVQAYITERMGAAGHGEYSMHSLRKYFCNAMVEGNINPVIIQKAMRHKSITSTLKYCSVNDRQVKDAVHSVFK